MKITKDVAIIILKSYETKEYETINNMGLFFFGNKGRMWNKEGCLTDLDNTKGECNPRLSSNYCRDAQEFGCPKCLEELERIANEAV